MNMNYISQSNASVICLNESNRSQSSYSIIDNQYNKVNIQNTNIVPSIEFHCVINKIQNGLA